MDPWSTLISGVVLFCTAGAGAGLPYFLNWLRERKAGQVAERATEREILLRERDDLIKERATIVGELRGEIHGLRDRLNAMSLQHETCLKENAVLRAQVRSLEERIGDLAASGGVAMVTIDQDDIVVAWSPSATEMFGYPASEVIGKKLGETIIPESLRGLHGTAVRQCVVDRRPPRSQPLILKAQDRWGREFLVDVSLYGFSEDSGKQFFGGMIRRRADRFAGNGGAKS